MRKRAEKWPLRCAPLEARWTPRRSDEIWVSLEPRSGVLDFPQMAASDVVDEAADGDGLGNPRMGAELLQLVADIFFDVLEGVEEGGSNGGGSGAILDSGAQVLLGGEHQSAIGVIDDHDFLGAQEVVRYDQGAQGVFRHDAAGIADDVRISRFQAQGANGKPGIHTGQDGELALGARGQFAQFMGARVNFVGSEDLVNDAHGQNSLAKPKRVSSERIWEMLGRGASELATKERARHAVPPYEELQLRFDGFGEFFVADQTLNFFHDFPVAGDEEAGGIAEKAAELVGDFVVADDDGIVHGEFLAVDVEAFLGDEGSDGALAVFVHRDAQNGEAFRFVLLLHFDEPRNFDVAGLAPGGPEIDQYDFALVLAKYVV